MNESIVLCIDVGNSQTVVGIYRGDEVVEYWRLTTPGNTTSDEIFLRIKLLIDDSSVGADEITHVGLSSVVPDLERVWTKAINKFIDLQVQVLSDENCLNLSIRYDVPKLLGADRIANVIAMKEMGLGSAIAIDLGTATTFDIMVDGCFYGGVILPGISSALEVLTDRAMRLPPVSLEWTESVIATNTEDSLKSGLLYGYVGQIDFLLKQIEEELPDTNFKIIGTGGWSITLGEKMERFDEFDHFLTLRGIRRLALQEAF